MLSDDPIWIPLLTVLVIFSPLYIVEAVWTLRRHEMRLIPTLIKIVSRWVGRRR
jgi:hypothetical protein